MASGRVVYVRTIKCSSCGLVCSGYLQICGGGMGDTTCPRCGVRVVQGLPPGHVSQIPPAGYIAPGQPAERQSVYPGLYAQPKRAPRYGWTQILMLPFHPERALKSILLSSDLRHALVIVLIFAMLSTSVSTIITADMAEVIGYKAGDAVQTVLQGGVSLIVTLLSFLVLGVVAALVSHEMFGGRGDRGSTITLIGYCYPWFTLLTLALLAVFSAGFSGLELSTVNQWTDADMERAIVWGAVLLVVAVLGFMWLLYIVGKAVGTANDIPTLSGSLSAILASVASGLLSLIVGTVMRLPIGLSF
jgi:hypothetical protein